MEQGAIMADPKMKSKLRKERRRQESRNDQKYWWRPGDAVPRRKPNLEEAKVKEVIPTLKGIMTP